MAHRPSKFGTLLRLLLIVTGVALISLIGKAYVQSAHAPSSAPALPAGDVVVVKPTFKVAHSLSLSGNPASVVTADVNNDGIPDLLIANSQTSTIEVFLGKGKGKFAAGGKFALGSIPTAMIAADFNGDGKVDLAVASKAGSSVSLLLGNGDGTFQTPVNNNVPTGPVFLAVRVSGGNNLPDLLVASAGANSISVLKNNGDGSFQAAKEYAVGTGPRAIAISDFDGDGNPDLASANSDGSITILAGDANGGFKPARSFSVDTALSAIIAADLNKDGHIDLAAVDSSTNRVHVLLGNGDGTFKAGATTSVGNGPVALAVGDVDADGLPDLLVANQASNTVSVLLGKGDGSFRSVADFVVGNGPAAVVIADLDGDGHLDLATADSAGNTISMPLGTGDGTFQAAQNYSTSLDVQSVAAGDLDGDGHPDIVVTNFCGSDRNCANGGSATIFLGSASGTFTKSSTIPLGNGPVAAALADINGDKKLDLLVLNQSDNNISIMNGNGDGTFQPATYYPVAQTPVAFAVADLNKDGKADLIIATQCGAAGCSQAGQITVFLGQADGSFVESTHYATGFSPVSVATGDLNRDGNVDVVIANACGKSTACTAGTATILLGDGKGKLNAGMEIDLAKMPSSLALGDLRGKGTLDLIATYKNADQMGVFAGNGDGTFNQQVLYSVGSGPNSVLTGKFSSSGHTDVAVANLNSSTVSLLRGNGDGTLQNPMDYVVGSAPVSIISADLTGKGKLDIVSSGGSALSAVSQITVLSNLTAPTPTATTTNLDPLSTVTYGTAVTFTATVSPAPTDSTADDVTFMDGANVLGTGTADPGTGVATFTTTATQLNAGSHSIQAVFAGTTGFAGSPSSTLTQNVDKEPLTVTAVSNTKTYDATTSAAGVPTITSGALQGTDTANFIETYDTRHAGIGKTLTPSGTVNDGNGGNNYSYTFAADTTGVINALPLTITAVTNTKTYDATTSAAGVPTITSGAVQGSDTANFIEAYDTRHAGTGKTLTPSGTVNDGNSGNDYSYTFVADTSGVINVQPLTITAVTNTKTYDATTAAAGVPTVTSGAVQGSDIANFTETYDTRHAGTGKTLTAAGSVNDGNGGNDYSYTFVTDATGVITARPLTITAVTNTKTYDATTAAAGIPAITSGTLQGSDTANFSETYDTRHAGTGKTLTASGTANDGNGGNDYSYTFVTNATGVISARPLTITAVTNTKTYDATTAAAGVPTITSGTVQGSDAANFIETYDTRHAGTGKTLTPSGSINDGNGGNDYGYTFITDATGVISARPLTITAVTNTKTYDGTTSVASVPVISSGVLQGSDTANFIETYDTKHFGTNKTLTPSGTANDGNSGADYTYSFVNDTTGVINQRPITVTAATDTKTYDQTTTSSAVPAITSGAIAPGDTQTLTEVFDSRNAGSRTLLPSAVTTDGNGGNNYKITFVTTSGTINKLSILSKITASDKTFDGTVAATILTRTLGGVISGDTVSLVGGTATFSDPHVAIGKTVTAIGLSLSGSDSGNYSASSTATNTASINQAKSNTLTTTLAAAINDPKNGATLTFTVIVTPEIGGTPTGNITVTADTASPATSKSLTPTPLPLDSAKCPPNSPAFAACATLPTTPGELAAGTYSITTVYNNDGANGDFQSSHFKDAITVLSEIDTKPGLTISPQTISFGDLGASEQIKVGCAVQSATIAVSIAFPKCSLNTPSITLPGQSVTLTISTSVATAGITGNSTPFVQAGLTPRHAPPTAIVLGMPFFGLLGVVLLTRSRQRKQVHRRLATVCGLMLIFAVFLLVLGCGGGSFNNPTNLQPPVSGSTQAGVYMVSVTGTDAQGNTVVVATVPLNVQF